MLLKAPRSKSRKTGQLDVAETFVIWDLLRAQYFALSRLFLWQNYVHDIDLGMIISREVVQIKKSIVQVENILDRYSIAGPKPNVTGINTSANSEVITDEYIARDILFLYQEALGMVCTGFKNVTTNDSFRKLFTKIAKHITNELDLLIKYSKLKGWIDIPPLYPNTPPDVAERLDVGEAFSLWDHLTYRYDNVQQTEVILEFAYDNDFKLLLKRGHGILKNQIQVLERELLRFGMPLPQAQSKLIPTPESTEVLYDLGMYRTIWLGIQASIVVHYESVKQSIVNDRIRSIFIDLLLQELDHMDKFVKYGKVKNWMNPTPHYTMEQE